MFILYTFLFFMFFSHPRGSNFRATEPHAWRDILQYRSSFELIIICGDVNEKSSLWSSHVLGSDGEGNRSGNYQYQLGLH